MSSAYHSSHTGAQVDAAVDRANIVWLLAARLRDDSFALPIGDDTVEVTGLGLSFLPVRALLTVEAPEGGMILTAVPVSGSYSQDGFKIYLTSAPDIDGYVLHFILLGEQSGGESGSESGS